MVHKDIRILFTVDGRRFEAVGFLNEGEPSVEGDEVLRRVPDAIGEEDINFLDERHGQDWSQDLWPYYLLTNRRNPGSLRNVRSFNRYDDGWHRCAFRLDGSQLSDLVLVVRRCA